MLILHTSTTRRMRRVSVAAGALSIVLLVAPWAGMDQADAATVAPGGQTCTRVGTPGDDVLSGTSSRDVICGLGGDDVIRGGGGNDVLVGGAGSDDLYAGAGSDDVYAGTGADDIGSAAGTDDVFGGPGGDEISGGSGDDDIFGQDGNDDLTGGRGADEVIGGDGTNWCTLDSQDIGTRCKYDREAAAAKSLELSRTFADVTESDKFGTVRVHVVDDTGVKDVVLSAYDPDTGASLTVGYAHLASGTIRDGWWEQSFRARRWTEPGQFTFAVDMRDRVRRSSSREWPAVFRLANQKVDRDLPTVTLLKPTESTVVDVRDEAQTVVVEARMKDAQSGVYDGNPFCLFKPVDGFYTNLVCPNAELVSGTRYDGVWRARIRIPRGEVGGDWNVSLHATDHAHPDETHMWLGPDVWRLWSDNGTNPDPYYPALPNGTGRFKVRGTTDSVAPSVTGVTISPSRIDTLPGPVRVKFEVTARDAVGEGVEAVGVWLHPSDAVEGSGVDFEFLDLRLSAGTKVNGTWSGSYDIPQGTPPGTYYLQVMVNDPTHYRSWFSPGSPYAEDPGAQKLTEPTELVVVANSAG